MYRILLVDDEHFVIKGINSCVDWQGNGFAPPLEAHSGEQALELLEREPVDIVYTDIKMSAMSGLDLLSEIKRREYDCEVIILSCHNDFAYSRAALQNGACDYLFKPEMLPEDILSAAHKACNVLEERRQGTRQLEQMRSQLAKTVGYRKESFMRELLDGKRVNRIEFSAQAAQLGIRISPESVGVAVFRSQDYSRVLAETYKGDEYLYKYAVANVLAELAEETGGCEVVAKSPREYVFLVSQSHSQAEARQRLHHLAYRVFDALARSIGVQVSCGIGPLRQPVEQLQPAYEAAAACIRDRMQARLVVFSQEAGGVDEVALPEDYRRWPGGVEERLTRMFRMLREQSGLTRYGLIDLCSNLISIELQWRAPGATPDPGVEQNLFSGLYRLGALEEFETYMLEFARRLYADGRVEIQRARAYMEKHLAEESLSLGEVADHVGMSKNYFSNQFKKEVGKGFTAYLTDLRLDKAKELYCTTNRKIYQIAGQVGFSDWRYLTRVYKKQRGHNLTGLKK